MSPVLKKTVRIFKYIFLSLLILILLLAGVVNLPFAHRIITVKVNNILRENNIPAQVGGITLLLNGKIGLNQIEIKSINGDTIVYAGNLGISVSLVPLLSNRIVVRNINLSDVVVNLITDKNTGQLNLLSLFPGSKQSSDNEVKESKPWEIQVSEVHLKNIRFLYHDSLQGVFDEQMLHKADLIFSNFSFLKKQIDINYLSIEQLKGRLAILKNSEDTVQTDSLPSPWKFSANNLELKDILFEFSQPESRQLAAVSLKQGNISVKTLNLAEKKLDITHLKLVDPKVVMETASANSTGNSNVEPVNNNSDEAPWSLICDLIKINNGSFLYNDKNADTAKNISQWMPVQEFNTTIKDIKYTSNSSGFKMSELSLALNNKAFIKSGEIFVAADSLRRGKVSIEMFASMNNEDQKIVSKNDTIHFSAAFSGSTDSLQIEKCNLDASSGIGLSVTGHIIDLLKLPDSRCEIKFNTKAITHDQATGLVALSGNRVNLPEFEPISFSGVVGNSILKPEFKLSVTSASGNIGLAGNYDIKNVNGELTASLSQVKLRKILGNEYPEWITCSLVLQGGLNNKKNINGKGVIEIDSVLYKDAISRKINIELSADNNQGHFKISANDTAITCMLNGLFGWEGRNYTGSLSGNFSLNENHNKLLPNYLAIRGEIDASFKSSGNNLESCLEMKNIGVSNLNSEANLKKFSVNLNMDDNSVNSQLETDFLTAGFKSMSSFNNLKNTIESIGFEKILSLDSADFLKLKAVSNLPVFNLAATVHYNSFFQLFYPDSVFNFQSINVAMDKKMEGNSVQSEITVDGFKYFNYKTYGAKMEMKLEEDKLNCKIILDSLDADSVLIGSSAVTLDILPTNMLGTISISDRKGLPLYQLGAETHKGRDKLIFKSTGSDWVINSGTWTMSPSEFLTRENATGDMVADLHLHHDDMKIDLSGRKSESMKLDIQNVSLSKVVSPVLIKDLPDGSITANVIYKEDNKKHLDFKFDIDQFKWKDVLINRIESKGKLLADTSGIIESNIVTNINDSSTITITSNTANNFHSTFNNVPVRILEPVLSEYINKMQGVVSGEVTLAGENNKSTIDGEIKLQKISLNVIPLKSWFSIPGDKILIKKNQIYFDHFTVLDSMQKQMNLDGKINLENPDDITCDLNLKLDDLRIMNTTVKDNPGFFGSIVVKSGLEISGPVKNPEIKGKVALENGTNITYRQIQDLTIKELQKTITFQKLNSDSIDNGFQKVQLKNISGVPLVQTVIEITPKSIFNVEITGGFENKITVSGSGLLNYSMLPNNTISLTGSYEVKTGTSELKFTGWPKKYFSITPGSSLRWDGKVDDPELNLEATSKVKGAYTNPIDNSNRNVDFIVSMKLSDQLSQLKLVFDVKSEDQYITSVLSSLAPDELMRQAVNLVLFEAIDLPGFESSTSYASAQMNSFWESQLNNLTKTSFKNVDLSFGIDTRKQVSAGGAEEEKTSLSYELERKLLNDRASVKLSGRVNDDTQPGEQSANVIENFIFEYELDTFNRKFLKIYRKQDYEDILEGEVIKSGAGFIYRKTYPKLSDIWKRKEKQKDASGQSSDKHE